MEIQNVSETLVEGSVDYKPVPSENTDGKTLADASVLSSLSESCVGSEVVTEVPSSDCGGNANGPNDVAKLVGVGIEQKLVDGPDNIDLEEVKSEEKLANADDNNDLEGVDTEKKLVDGQGTVEIENSLADDNNDLECVATEKKLVDGQGTVESENSLADDNNDLECVDTEKKLVDGQGTVESENSLANMDGYNDLDGVEIENKFGDVDDAIDLEALGLENDDVTLENLMEGETLKHETQALGSIIPETNKINDGDVTVGELGAEFNESHDNGVEKIGMVNAVEAIDTSNVQANDSPRKIEVSGDGISLTVDVFGPLDGMYPVHNSNCEDGQMTHNNGPDWMLSMKNDSPMGVNGIEAEGDVSDNQEHNFTIGDLVWVKIKTDLWWPGIICDPPASKDSRKCDQGQGFFVKHFGNTNCVWCQPFQLKPFIEYFEPMSCQNKSRSFYGAIEKALSELGRRVKQKMTCSCFSKENQVAAQNFPSKEDWSEGSVFLASQFEPSNFLKFIRSRALDLLSPGRIEFTITESCLLAFYSSIGHKQLPLYKLRPTNNAKDVGKDEDVDTLSSGGSVLKSCRSGSDDCKMTEMELSGSLESPRGMRSMISCSQIANEDADRKSEKGVESRERKKSKYLSYPYVNSWGHKNSLGQGEDETEDLEEASLGGVKSSSSPAMVSTPIGNSNNKNPLRKSRKFVNNGICNNADFADVSSADMLQELHLTALDCFFPIQSMCSVPIQDFYLSFRTFRDPEVLIDKDKDATLGCQGTLESDNILASGGQPPQSVLPKRRGRKKSEDISATGMNGSAHIDPVGTGPDALKKGIVHRKKKKAGTATVIHNEVGVLGGLPDLNGNNAGLSVENMQVIGPAPTQGKLEPKRRRRKKEELVSENLPDGNNSNTQFIPLLKSMDATSSFPLEGNAQPDSMLGVQVAFSLPNENHAACSSLPNNSQIMGLVSSAKADGKKRQRKEKAAANIQNISSTLPDLNGQVTDPNLKGKEFAELSSVTGQDKPKRKRRRATKSAATGIPNPNGDHNILLLNFSLGSPVPSKEYIAASFSGFGPLEESKCQYLNDSTAQVVFVKGSDAMEALQSLQSRNPFGPSLVSYRLRQVSTSNNAQMSHSFLPTDVLQPQAVLSGAVPSNGDGPDLVVIKQNLEAMTTMLEKAGDNISPEMRAKLESEVKGFLKKVSTMVGSSSS